MLFLPDMTWVMYGAVIFCPGFWGAFFFFSIRTQQDDDVRCLCVFGENFPEVRRYEGHILAVSAMDLLEARTVGGWTGHKFHWIKI